MAHLDLPLGRSVHSRLLQLDPSGRLHDGQAPAPLGGDQIEWLLERGMSLDGVEQALLSGALDKAGGNRSQAARALGLTRRQFNYRFSKRSLAGR